ncbi:MAG: hypothetical protein WBM87_08805 [Woeseiaceae bacterium]
MFRAGSKTIKTWIVIYAGFMAAIVFAENGTAMTLPEPADVSPVVMQAAAPVLKIEAVVRRSDI